MKTKKKMFNYLYSEIFKKDAEKLEIDRILNKILSKMQKD
jgi:hypothetical protein